MKNDSIVFVRMDTHKEFTEIAYSLDGRDNDIIHLGRIQSTKQGLLKLARQLQSKYPHATLHFMKQALVVTGCTDSSLNKVIAATLSHPL